MRVVAGVLCVTVLGLLTLGFVMLTSTSSAYPYHGDAYAFAKRQALWLAIGLVACVAVARVDYRQYRRYAWPLFLAAIVLLVAVLILGRPINGAKRWLVFGPVRFQPSEVAKYVLVIVLAGWLEKMQRAPKGQLRPRIQHWGWGVFAPLAIALAPAALIVVEPDWGMAVLLGGMTLLLIWVAGAPTRWVAGILGVAVFAGVVFLVAILEFGMFEGSYQVDKIVHWWRWDDLQGSNHQQWMGMLAFGSGGPWGRGLGNSMQKMGYLPEARTDFVFPIVGEELGVIATLGVVVAFGVLVAGGMLLVRRSPDLFGLLLGSGIVATIGLQAMINMAVVTNVVPNKGMPLPFISYGGSNLVMTLAALGVLFNIYRQAHAHAVNLQARPSKVQDAQLAWFG